jgi:hypothetical protein
MTLVRKTALKIASKLCLMVLVGVMGGSFHASLRAPKSIYVSIPK